MARQAAPHLPPSVIVRGNPFSSRLETFDYQPGDTLAQIVARAGCGSHVTVQVDDHTILPGMLHVVRPKPGHRITVISHPQGGDSSVLLQTVALIALAVLAPYGGQYLAVTIGSGGLVTTTAGAAALTAITTAGVFAVGALAINALIPIADQPDTVKQASSSRSVGATSNRVEPYGTLPFVLGGPIRVTPPMASLPYTENAAGDQYVRLLYAVSQKNCRITAPRLGETDVTSYQGVTYEKISGDTGDAAEITAYATDQDIKEVVVGTTVTRGNPDNSPETGTFVEFTTEAIDALSVDLAALQGLLIVKDQGDTEAVIVTCGIQYAVAGTTNWSTPQYVTFKGKAARVFRKNFFLTMPANAAYDVRVWRTSNDHEPDGDKPTYLDDITLTVYRQINYRNAVNHDDVALAALRIKATNQLNGTPDRFNCEVTSLLPTWDGSDWDTEAATNNPAAIYREILTGKGNKQAVATTRLDNTSISGFYDFCADNGFACNYVVDTRQTVWELMRLVCACGRGRPVMIDGLWGVVWDTEQATPVAYYTPRNSWGFTGSKAFPDIPDAFRIPFKNEREGWADDEVVVYRPGKDSTTAATFEQLQLPGITDPDQIYLIGRYNMLQAIYRPELFEFYSDAEHLVCTVGDRIEYLHDAILVGQVAARIASVATDSPATQTTLVLDADVTFVQDTVEDVELFPEFEGDVWNDVSGISPYGSPWYDSAISDGVWTIPGVANATIRTAELFFTAGNSYTYSCTISSASPPIFVLRNVPDLGGSTVIASGLGYYAAGLYVPTQDGYLEIYIVDLSGTGVTADSADFSFTADVTTTRDYAVTVRRTDGTGATASVVAPSDSPLTLTTSTITLASVVTCTAEDMVLFGESAKNSIPLLVKDIEPGPDLGAKLTCVQYSPEVYSAIGDPPPYNSYITLPAPRPVPSITSVVSDESVMTRDIDGSWRIQALVSIAFNASRDEVAAVESQYRMANTTESWRSDSIYPFDVVDIAYRDVIEGETYQFRVRYLYSDATYSEWVSATHTIVGKSTPPPNVSEFQVSTDPDGTRVFIWAQATNPPDLAGWRLRYAEATGGGTYPGWDGLTALHDGVLTSTRYETNQLPAATYWFAVKSIDSSGNLATTETEGVTYLSYTLPDPRLGNVAKSINVNPTWAGAPDAPDEGDENPAPASSTTGCQADATTGYLVPTEATGSPTPSWATLPATWNDWGEWNHDPIGQMVYTHPVIEFGAVTSFQPVVTLSYAATQSPVAAATVEYRYSTGDSPDWTGWATLTSGTTVTSDSFQFRVTLDNPEITGLRSCLFQAVVDPVVENATYTPTGSPAWNSSTATTRRFNIPLVKTFAYIEAVNISIVSSETDAGWTWQLLDTDETGPEVLLTSSKSGAADPSAVLCHVEGY